MSEVFYNAKNLTISNGFVRNPDRYYLEEYFKRRPALNLQIATSEDAANTIIHNVANKDFEILGTNASKDDVTFSSTEGGIQLQTDTADNDQVIVLPHLDTDQTAWSGIKWGTENQVEWECAIRTGSSIADTSFWAGLKLTNVPAYATDADQAYFLYASDDDQGALETNANLHFVYSVGGTDYITDLGIAVAAAATSGNGGIYKLRIVIDNNRQVAVYVNGVQYGLLTTATAGGATQSTATTLSNALTNDIDLIPYVGVQALTGSAKQITLCYEKISRVLFE
jgi:hypothetical protein